MRMIELDGEMLSMQQAARKIGIPLSTLYQRLKDGVDLKKAPRFKYEAGQKFNRLTLLEPVNPKLLSKAWILRCDCGNLTKADACAVRIGGVKSCGCLQLDNYKKMKGRPKLDLTNKNFGKLKVVCLDKERESDNNGVYWICRCLCGGIVSVPTKRLNRSKTGTKSCGCLRQKYMTAEFMELIRPIAANKYRDYILKG